MAVMASKIKNKLDKKKLSEKEWRQYVGDDIEYPESE